MERYLCIHGHFYQPPRENPWLEAIELQDQAHPYHDWNERITAECYVNNAASRILDEQGRIVQMVNNYSKMSFNFGPTLLGWMEVHAPDVYAAVLEADRESQKVFSGHGSALAQAYNHIILPLATSRDKQTQVLWGIRDFEYRFGRKPEGMWLPETAVDLETLDILAEQGIHFTILAPRQAGRVRSPVDGEWRDVSGGNIDPTMAYKLRLPSGRGITLFFYDGPISRAVAFEGLLSRGESFAQRLLDGFSERRTWPQLAHIATDGETYGHHHRFGDMALAYAVDYIESNGLATFTNYGEYLEKHPPSYEVEIVENTSWSCAHGVERWRSDCGCNSGGHPGWSQAWRAPLRQSLDWLRDTLAPAYEQRAGSFLRDPWRARDEYIQVILDRSRESQENFLAEHVVRQPNEAETITVLKLLELQRHAMLMYTSCGWFFDDLSGIETVQIIQYAGRALQLAEEVYGNATEERFLEMLGQAQSNIAEYQDGRIIYDKFVRPATLDLAKVGAHYALSSLFEDYDSEAWVFCYKVDLEDYQAHEAGKAKLALGRARLTSEVTREFAELCFGVLHWGDHNLSCCLRGLQPEEDYDGIVEEVAETFAKADFPKTLRMLEEHFGRSLYSLRSLFRDEQRKILDLILQSTLVDAEALYRQLYEYNSPLLRFLKDLGNPPPRALQTAAELVLNLSLRRALEREELDPDSVNSLLDEARLTNVSLDTPSLEMAMRRRIEAIAGRLLTEPFELSALDELTAATDILAFLPFEVNLRQTQNICYEILQSIYPQVREQAGRGEPGARQWAEDFRTICAKY